MIEAKTTTINGVGYQTTQFPGRAGLKLQARLARLIGPVVGGLVPKDAAGADSVLDLDLDIGGAMRALAQVDPDEFAALAEALLQQTRRDGKEITPAIIDLEFAGKYGELYKVLAWVIDVNFASLFGDGGISGLAARFGDKGRKPEPSASSRQS